MPFDRGCSGVRAKLARAGPCTPGHYDIAYTVHRKNRPEKTPGLHVCEAEDEPHKIAGAKLSSL